MLIEMIKPAMAVGSTILDVGGGIGVVAHELLRAGAGHVVLVDASVPYLAAARNEANRQNHLERIDFVEGNFVQRAAEVDPADVVTLDRVICCYPDAQALVGLSSARARKIYGLVLPRESRFIRLSVRLMNLGFRLRRRAYRAYAHSNGEVDRIAAEHGLWIAAERSTWFWRVVIYHRQVQ